MAGKGKGSDFESEQDVLSKIIKEINERYGTNFNDSDKIILNDLSKRLINNTGLQGTIQNNSKDSAKLRFDQLFQDELVSMLDNHFNLYQKLDQSPELKKYVQDRVFEIVVKNTKVE
jgi:type I restriction enzyme R subunit